MEANAGKEWEDKLKELEAKQTETQQKINALQAAQAGRRTAIHPLA